MYKPQPLLLEDMQDKAFMVEKISTEVHWGEHGGSGGENIKCNLQIAHGKLKWHNVAF